MRRGRPAMNPPEEGSLPKQLARRGTRGQCIMQSVSSLPQNCCTHWMQAFELGSEQGGVPASGALWEHLGPAHCESGWNQVIASLLPFWMHALTQAPLFGPPMHMRVQATIIAQLNGPRSG